MGYRHVLGGLLLTFALIIAAPPGPVAALVRIALLGVLLVVAVRARRSAGALSWRSLALAVLALAATVVAAVVGSSREVAAVSAAATAILVIVTIVVIARTVLGTHVVDGAAVRGVLCVYLLLALLFSAVYQFFGQFTSGFLNGASDYATASETLYFSVITLATVGYGDITPATDLARAIAVTQALTGQLYLVSVVAVVVSRYRRGASD